MKIQCSSSMAQALNGSRNAVQDTTRVRPLSWREFVVSKSNNLNQNHELNAEPLARSLLHEHMTIVLYRKEYKHLIVRSLTAGTAVRETLSPAGCTFLSTSAVHHC